MKKIIIIILALILSACASAESLPQQAGLDAAQAVAAMHDAMMRDYMETDYTLSELAGAEALYVLYTDADARNFLMVSLGEAGDSADIAVIQSYSLAEFDKHVLLSLTALSLPFIPEENMPAFEEWRDSTAEAAAAAAAKGQDMELSYYTGEYIACAMSVFHDDAGPMFTALVSWHTPLTAEDITLRMEGMTDGQADDK